MLWFGERRVTNTHVTNTPVHAADERRVECSLAHEQSGVGGGPFFGVAVEKSESELQNLGNYVLLSI